MCAWVRVQLRHHGLGSRTGISLSASLHFCDFCMQVVLQGRGKAWWVMLHVKLAFQFLICQLQLTYTYMYVGVYAPSICIYTYMYICINVYVCMCICMCVCLESWGFSSLSTCGKYLTPTGSRPGTQRELLQLHNFVIWLTYVASMLNIGKNTSECEQYHYCQKLENI